MWTEPYGRLLRVGVKNMLSSSGCAMTRRVLLMRWRRVRWEMRIFIEAASRVRVIKDKILRHRESVSIFTRDMNI